MEPARIVGKGFDKMNRRGFLAAGAAVAGAAVALAPDKIAAQAARGVRAAPVAGGQKFKIHGYGVGKLTEPGEMADMCLRAGLDGLNVTVRPGRYIEPANVRRELPRFVNAIRNRGLVVQCYTANIYDADTPHAEAIMDTAAQLGLHRYRSGTLYYDRNRPIQPQIDALKPRFAKLNRLLEKYDQNAMYHLYSDPNTVGAAVWDLMQVMKDYDPRHMSWHWDTGHAVANRGLNTWQLDMRLLGPYIGGVSVKDMMFVPNHGAEAEAYLKEYRDGLVAQCPAAPVGCTGTPGKWRKQWTKLGEGYVDLISLGEILKEINFAGTVEMHLEYGGDSIDERIAAYAADTKTLKAAWAPLGLV